MIKIVLFFIILTSPALAYGQDLTELYSRNSLDQIKAYHQRSPVTPESLNKPFGSRGDTALCAAARRNSAEVVAYLLSLQADPCYARTSDKTTPLMIAARESQHPEVVDILARSAAQKGCLDAVDRNGNTALMHAAMKTASTDIVRRLMDNNADPRLENTDNADALHLIRHNRNFSPLDSVVRELADYEKSYVPSLPPTAAIETPLPPIATVQSTETQKNLNEPNPVTASPVWAPPIPESSRTTEPSSNLPPQTATGSGSTPGQDPGSIGLPAGQLHIPQDSVSNNTREYSHVPLTVLSLSSLWLILFVNFFITSVKKYKVLRSNICVTSTNLVTSFHKCFNILLVPISFIRAIPSAEQAVKYAMIQIVFSGAGIFLGVITLLVTILK